MQFGARSRSVREAAQPVPLLARPRTELRDDRLPRREQLRDRSFDARLQGEPCLIVHEAQSRGVHGVIHRDVPRACPRRERSRVRLDRTAQEIARYDALLNERVAAFDDQIALLCSIPGIQRTAAIEIFAEGKALKKVVMSIVTDSTPVEAPKDPARCNVFQLYSLFATPAEKEALATRYRAGGMGYGEVKQLLFEKIDTSFAPARQKRKELAAHPEQVEAVLRRGAERARAEARKTMALVREAVGFRPQAD